MEGDSYIEKAEREVQLTLLAHGRADVVVGERRLLTYIMQQQFPQQSLAIHRIFTATPYGAVVNDEELQRQFDQQLDAMKASGQYQKIMARWQ